VAAFRVARAGRPAAAVLEAWADDPVRDWATELVVQTQPAGVDVAGHRATLRALAAHMAAAVER
jgi:hypothetical protein